MKSKAEIGQKIPSFSLPCSAGNEFVLKDFAGKKVVIYFYPKDSTPGCTLEGQQFNKLLADFKKANAVVIGISRDSLKAHAKFIDSCGFKFHLASDPEEVACKIFDVIKEKNMYGRKVLGIERSTFLVSESGRLLREWRKVKADGHAAEVLAACRE